MSNLLDIQPLDPQEERKSYIYLHIGAKQTGKTQGTLDMVADFLFRQKKRVLIFDINNQSEYDEYPLITIDQIPYWKKLNVVCCRQADDIDMFFWTVQNYVRNTCIVFEDSTSYMQGNLSQAKERAILNSRNASNDMIFNLHSLASVAPFLYMHSEYVILRRTSDPPRLPPKVPNQHIIMQAREEIAEENARLYSDVKHKLACRLIDLHA